MKQYYINGRTSRETEKGRSLQPQSGPNITYIHMHRYIYTYIYDHTSGTPHCIPNRQVLDVVDYLRVYMYLSSSSFSSPSSRGSGWGWGCLVCVCVCADVAWPPAPPGLSSFPCPSCLAV